MYDVYISPLLHDYLDLYNYIHNCMVVVSHVCLFVGYFSLLVINMYTGPSPILYHVINAIQLVEESKT